MEGGERMKEAAGEANMTVITIVLIGVVAAVGAIFIPKLLTNMQKKSTCTELGGTLKGDTCTYKDFSSNPDGVSASCTMSKGKDGTWTCTTSAKPKK